MKQLYFLLIAITFSLLSFAQKEGASRLYGFRQKSLPGTVRVDAVGRELPRQPRFNYFIYLASASKVTPVEVWINGEAYAVTATTVSSTPVEYIHPHSADGKARILVPKTTRKVLQLAVSPEKAKNPNSRGKTLSAKNELVVIYKGNGKLYYKAVAKLEELEPVGMQ